MTTAVAPGAAVGTGSGVAPCVERLAMLFEGLTGDGHHPTFGAQTAVEGFTRAILRHSSLPACDLLGPACWMSEAGSQLSALAGQPCGPTVTLHPLEGAAPRLGATSSLVMHDPTGDLWRLHYFRSHVAPGDYPITVLHHTMSYTSSRYATMLPLLMARCRPYDALVCSSQAAREAIRALLGQVRESVAGEYALDLDFSARLEVIPLGVDTSVFRPRDRRGVRAHLGLPTDATVLLALGRFSISDKMDLAPLLLVLRRLVHAGNRQLQLVVAGSDPNGYARAVVGLAQEIGVSAHVRIITDVPAVLPPLLYAAADIFVSLPDSVQEMFGQTPVEAMASGLPVVIADWDGCRETVVHGETGFRVPTMWGRCDADVCGVAPLMARLDGHRMLAQSVAVDLRALHGYLQRLIDDQALRQELGQAGRRRALVEYDWAAVVRRYEALWEELALEARTGSSPAPAALGFARPDYSSAFAHFPTRMMTPNTRLEMTDLGEQTLRGKQSLRMHPLMTPYLDTAALRHVLALLRIAGRLRRTLPAAELAEVLHVRHHLTEPAAQRHLLWLIKYGLAAPAEE